METSESGADPRQEILYRYRLCEITREQADSEARALGFESLEFRPDAKDFDPLGTPFWSMPMALAWIIYRRREPVRELIEEYRAQSLVWRHAGRFSTNNGKTEKLFELLRPEPKGVFDVVHEANCRDNQTALVLSGAGGRNQLWDRLEAGKLIAEGIPAGQIRHSPIRDAEWKTIAFMREPGIEVDAVAGWGENTPRFTQVMVRSADVLALWPEQIKMLDGQPPLPTLPHEGESAGLALPASNPDSIPERAFYSAERAEMHRYAVVSQKAWEPPASFSVDLLSLFVDPRIWLRDAVDFMAFGASCDVDWLDLRKIGERLRAAKTIFEAARRQDLVLIGCGAEQGDNTEEIPSHHFDLQRTLGNIDNSIEIHNDEIPDDDFYAYREKNYKSYRHVRIEKSIFCKWVSSVAGNADFYGLDNVTTDSAVGERALTHTGAAGRPTSMHFLITRQRQLASGGGMALERSAAR